MFGLGFQELLIMLVIVLLLFGGKKLPEIASGLGKAVRELKRGTAVPEPPASTNGTRKPLAERSVTDDTKKNGAHL